MESDMSRRALFTLVFLLISTGLGAESDSTYYMWRGEDGVLSFSQTAPRDVEFEEVKKEPRPFGYLERQPREAETIEMPEELQEVLDRRNESRSGEIDSDDIARMNEETRRRNCLAAKRNKEQLTDFRQIILRGDDGVWREVDDNARAEEMAEVDAIIAENCTDA